MPKAKRSRTGKNPKDFIILNEIKTTAATSYKMLLARGKQLMNFPHKILIMIQERDRMNNANIFVLRIKQGQNTFRNKEQF